MQVRRLATTQTVTVTLTLGGGVKLSEPQLWQLSDGQDAKLQDPSQDDSHARWSGIPAPAPETDELLDLTVYWNAIEPEQDQWNYSAFIRVTDQNGALLPADDGENPREITDEIGEGQTSFDRGSHPVFVRA